MVFCKALIYVLLAVAIGDHSVERAAAFADSAAGKQAASRRLETTGPESGPR
jgi:hypothetical protein